MRHFFVLLLLLTYYTIINAQVLVSQEPRHKPIFENDKVRLLNVLLPPGDTTQYHLHNTPSLFLFFTSTTTGSQLQGGAASTGRSTAGTILFENLAPPHTRIHRVWNIDKDTFHVMDIELLSKDSGFATKPLTGQQLHLAVDTPWVRAYEVTLEPQNNFNIHNTHRPLLLIAMVNAHVRLEKAGARQERTVQPSTFFWIASGQKFTLRNLENTTAYFALVEVP